MRNRYVTILWSSLRALHYLINCCCSAVLCDPTDCSMPDFPVYHHLLEFAQPRVHWVGDAIQPFNPLGLSCGTKDLWSSLWHVASSSQTRDRTLVHCIGGGKSSPLDYHGSPKSFLESTFLVCFAIYIKNLKEIYNTDSKLCQAQPAFW